MGHTGNPWAEDRRALSRRRRFQQAAFDGGAWAVALYAAALLRLDFDLSRLASFRIEWLIVLAATLQIAAGYMYGLYRGRYMFGSFEEVIALGRSVALVGAVLLGVDLLLPGQRAMPVSAVLGGALLAFPTTGAIRFGRRLTSEHRQRATIQERTRVLVFGAGVGGRRAIRAMFDDPHSPFRPVAIIDDDRDLANLEIRGVQVVGDHRVLAAAAAVYSAEVLLIAVPSADAALIGRMIDLATPLGLKVRVLPSARELVGHDVQVSDIREPTDADLLGRHQVDTDLATVAQYVSGRVVAVTGAGGSIGSELCRQLSRLKPAELIMIDRDESALHAVQLSIAGRALLDSQDTVLLDIRDRVRVAELFRRRRPDVVFHAAALKHLPLLESQPIEAFKTNVWGTLSVLEAAADAGVRELVNISTDKAANPSSVLGYSKRVAEGLTAHVARRSGGRYVSVRFGNVLGSRGSVLTTFRAQIDAGGPVTVTHPDISRYFMTVEEAVQLVMQAGAIGESGEVLVLDMGEPVRIADVARRLASRAQRHVTIEYTGLRAGEKLHEELFGDSEIERRAAHPMIQGVEAPRSTPSGYAMSTRGRSTCATCCATSVSGCGRPTSHVPRPPTT
ncbi:MAG: polysaccharide biosynthesis protein [Acidimicrobiia bacterium]|nr:polysaccharide biosynthesis protein [Acidimicrobiia bacterium]